MKKAVAFMLTAVVILTLVGLISSAAPIKVTFWSGPNPLKEVFWRNMAKKFNASQDEVQVYVTAMVESPTSEATITNAVAGGKAPAASGNIFPGFGASLANSKALVPLDTMPGWDEVVKSRAMQDIIKDWTFPDGHVYILPVYCNPMLYGWRIDILKELGYDAPPTTYSGIMNLGKALKEKYPNKFVMVRKDLLNPTWWIRWFDFFMLYDAASNGQPFVTGNKVTADDAAVVKVFKFYQDMVSKNYLLLKEASHPFETGLSVWNDVGPWAWPSWKENFPELKLNKTVVLAPPPVPDDVTLPAGAKAKTFADAKGVVIYAQHSPEEQQAVWKFLKWVFTDSVNEREWIDITGMLPVRGDLTTNQTFAKVFEEHPELQAYAAEMPYAVPAIANLKFADIQTAIGNDGLVPLLMGKKTPEQAWTDTKAAIEAILAQQ